MSQPTSSNPLASGPEVIDSSPEKAPLIKVFLCGDVMTGRGIDQALPYPCDPILYEPYVRNAKDYVYLAERANGPLRRPLSPAHIWGDALDELERVSPDFRIINL